MKERNYCGTTQAAKILGVSVGTVQNMVEQEILVAWKTIGGHRRITLDSIRNYQENTNQNSDNCSSLDFEGVRQSEYKKLQEENLDKETISLYKLLVSNDGKNKGLIFSIEKLAKKLGIEKSKVIKSINALKEMGVITIYKADVCDIYLLNYFSDFSYDWIKHSKIVIENIDLKCIE